MAKRTLDGFFSSVPKKTRVEGPEPEISEVVENGESSAVTNHATYPWPVPHLPAHITTELEQLVTAQGKEMRDRPHLDMLYFQPYIPKAVQRELFTFLRSHLFWYRVTYTIKRFGKETVIRTPRFTTVFGVDDTSIWEDGRIVDASSHGPVLANKYRCRPRPIPECLDFVRRVTEATTGARWNFCLVNYYATGADSISYHSDDEHFLGPDPTIASFTLGARRDFLMKHKPPKPGQPTTEAKDIKLSLGSGDLVVMRGPTQANWLHSIPKRKGGEADHGRINITLRRALVPAGTENYYRYNVGDGGVFKWDSTSKQMVHHPT